MYKNIKLVISNRVCIKLVCFQLRKTTAKKAIIKIVKDS